MKQSCLSVSLILTLSFLVACLGGASPSLAQDEYVSTPFGPVPKECVFQHPAETTLQRIEGGVRAVQADGTVKEYKATEKCLAFGKAYKGRSIKGGPRTPGQSTPIPSKWVNFAEWTWTNFIGKFTATYTIPQLPANPGSQNIYYFIGLQDYSMSPFTILQPVIGYNQNGGDGWTLSSWNCCPSGQVHQGNVVKGMGPGDTIEAAIVQTSQGPRTYAITGNWQGNVASLNLVLPTEAFNDADVVLEIYNVSSCDQFMTGPFIFSNIALFDTTPAPVTPNWYLTPTNGRTVCNGKLTISGTTITIQENLPMCRDVNAGPIWDNTDAQTKCPATCSADSDTWNGQWKTTIPAQMSVCGCCGN